MNDTSYLIFTLHGARYGVAADAVLEIFSLPELAPAPLAPPDIAGLIDLRGTIMPVVDLHVRFGLPWRRYLLSDSVIVLAYEGRLLGIMVDEVHDVRRIGTYEMQPVPEYGDTPVPGGRFVTALASVGGIITAIASLERLFGNLPDELSSAVEAAKPDDTPQRLSPGFIDSIDPADLEAFRSRRDALRERPSEADAARRTSLAVVSFGDELFGIGLEAVREFAQCGEIAGVPCSPPHIVGLANLRGDILTLVDIRGILGIAAGEREAVLDVVVAQVGEGRIGIVVDDIEGVIHVPSEAIPGSARSARGSESPYAPGSILHGDHVITLLDIPAIINSGVLVVEEEVV